MPDAPVRVEAWVVAAVVLLRRLVRAPLGQLITKGVCLIDVP
jgi:hypothetical protein